MTTADTTPRGRPETRRCRSYLLRLSEEEMARWREAAQRHESTMAVLIRSAVEAAIDRGITPCDHPVVDLQALGAPETASPPDGGTRKREGMS